LRAPPNTVPTSAEELSTEDLSEDLLTYLFGDMLKTHPTYKEMVTDVAASYLLQYVASLLPEATAS